LKLVLIIIFIIIVLGVTSINESLGAASPSVENFTQEGNEQPDEECLYDPSLPKCTPGPEGCPIGFSMNAYEQCFPKHQGGCPKGYHSHEDDVFQIVKNVQRGTL
jgi:hypothetical protein